MVLHTAEPLSREEIIITLRRLHYGSDWPFTPTDTAARLADEIDASDVFDDALRRKILLDHALALFPRLQVPGVDHAR